MSRKRRAIVASLISLALIGVYLFVPQRGASLPGYAVALSLLILGEVIFEAVRNRRRRRQGMVVNPDEDDMGRPI